MKWILFIFLVLLCVNLQQYPFDRVLPYAAVPSFLFVFALFASLNFKYLDAFICCWLAGLAMDLFSGFDFHIHSLLLPAELDFWTGCPEESKQ